jgi:hypothetical protein
MVFKGNELGFRVNHGIVCPNDPILGMGPIFAHWMLRIFLAHLEKLKKMLRNRLFTLALELIFHEYVFYFTKVLGLIT